MSAWLPSLRLFGWYGTDMQDGGEAHDVMLRVQCRSLVVELGLGRILR